MSSHIATPKTPKMIKRPARATVQMNRRASDVDSPRLDAGFVSQLLVSRQRLASQHLLSGGPTNLAVNAYQRANATKVRRMPVGYAFNNEA